MLLTNIIGNENIKVNCWIGKIGKCKIKNSKWEELLGTKLDWKVNFGDHISDTGKNTSGKPNALFIKLSKRRVLLNTFFNSQFDYCHLIWMCHNRTNNRKTNMHEEKCLRIIYTIVFRTTRKWWCCFCLYVDYSIPTYWNVSK